MSEPEDSARILLIDADDKYRASHRRYLSEAGFAVHEATDYASARAALEGGRFDLIFVDVFRGQGDGPGALEAVQRLGGQAHVILTTADMALELTLAALPLKSFFHLRKPVHGNTLVRLSRIALEHRAGAVARRQVEEAMAALFQGVSEALVLLDRQLVIRRVNKAAGELCGLAPSFVGRPFAALEGECAARLLEIMQKALEEGSPSLRVRLFCKDPLGHDLSLSVNAIPIFGGVVLVIHDRSAMVGTPGLVTEGEQRVRFHRMLGGSPRMLQIYSMIEDLAGIQTTVLIVGESGTGKELAAEALHYQGARAKGPLVKVNCSALPDTLLESELFGHVKGAFTGAVRDRVGRFEMAHKGTLFLDEIGDISPNMQVRLLRAIQESQFERVGDSATIQVDVRVITATNRNLRERVQSGAFREDLYYRLNVVELLMPPLRERREDIPLLVEHFIQKFNSKYGKPISGVTDKVMELFVSYAWPGNVRELEHVIEHAFVTCHQSAIRVKHLPRVLTSGQISPGVPVLPPADVTPPAMERDTILRALEATHWKKNAAAKALGISRSSLYRKLERLKIG